MDLTIDLAKLRYTFQTKPLLIGGKAMEFYALRPAGDDIDFVVTRADHANLVALYPEHTKDLSGDLGVCTQEFEIWTSICLFDYNFLAVNALEAEHYLIISLEKLLFLKALGMQEPKYEQDSRLIVKKILDIQYDRDTQPGA
ncbi:MAG TPA: hypothetical protein VHZ51_30555 [Ktedonobacteraceae bacterium]|jgi:hypothetical protein|nr:hypothetical protein [Ktedonobacteraceae bacterium]